MKTHEATVTSISISDPKLHTALRSCWCPFAAWPIINSIPRSINGSRNWENVKNFYSAEEHAELMALINFTQKRSIEKLEAEVALERLREFFPDVVDAA